MKMLMWGLGKILIPKRARKEKKKERGTGERELIVRW